MSTAKPNTLSIATRITRIIALWTLVLITAHTSIAQESITFPSRSQDLAFDSYWAVSEYSEGCCTIDVNVVRWGDNFWRGGSGNAANSQNFDWNIPLYAPANGTIASCWRNFPDNPKPGPDRVSGVFSGGNHVVIITDDGYAISMLHMKTGSIPANLCPINNDNTAFPSTNSKNDGVWRDATYILPENRLRIKEGQFVGRVGNSGNSGGPHLHMSMKPVLTEKTSAGREKLGNSVPMRFRHAWGHRFEAGEQHTTAGWYRRRGAPFEGNPDCPTWQSNAPECGFKTIHPSPYLRRANKSAGAIKGLSTIFLSSNRVVTATIGTGDNLKLVSWDLEGVEAIHRKGETTQGKVKDVKIVEPTSNYVLAATRLMDNRLRMIAFKVTATGEFVRVDDFTAGKVTSVDMTLTGGSDKKAVTAVRTASGDLKLIAWDIVVASNGTASVVRLGEDSAGAISSLAIARAKNFNGVFAAVRDGDNKLKVVPWKLSTNGNTFTRGASGSAGTIKSGLSVAPLGEGVAVAVRDAEGDLRVVTWSASANGNIGERKDTRVAGKAAEIKLLSSPNGGSNLTTVLRSGSDNLLLVGWAVNNDGTNLRRVGSSRAGGVSAIAADVISRSYPGQSPRDMILTGVRTASGDLKLVTWDTNLVNP